MEKEMSRRDFIQLTAGGCALCLAGIGCQQRRLRPHR
ncbi:MAG: twin-arginine translocation signal domain-containing protein [Phycisphaerae bacterium]|nr:twin-arginine translocation signal domain-containing protein [Phycisphaerae bacterium]NIP54757.1 twin-arginine translocation signal domain-containing protein [Phycisphaerae bacterium]NIS50469.1 twin-arginine translocation signal domain-containing protein [Phycisphaerae bacterium]NIU11074.1 twin-arginine translocation signal domain-containing protein [Phycisphaerae bacterium]NIU58960.1 twin-arginine translocation signal domain-containing protein [Phycisphaerae bacterium]